MCLRVITFVTKTVAISPTRNKTKLKQENGNQKQQVITPDQIIF